MIDALSLCLAASDRKLWALALLAATVLTDPAGASPPPASVPLSASLPAASPPAAAAGERAFAQARARLVQVRTLLKSQDSQSSVGSGFLVSDEGHLISNYHVVSQYALRPGEHRLVYTAADGRQGALQLLAVDVVNDLALLRPVEGDALAGQGQLSFRPAEAPLQRGERIFALGNPLDVGFAVVEGVYNGLVERSFVPTLFFGGSLSSGMSGGPAIDDQGRVIGINVASRRDGEQVSFLVPSAAAQALLARGRAQPPVVRPLHDEMTRQILQHQQALADAFLAQPWRKVSHAGYDIPVPQEVFLRCWGSSSPGETRGLRFERSDCVTDHRVFVSGSLLTGHLSVRHETYDGRSLGMLRFAQRHAASFANEGFRRPPRHLTPPQCHEGQIERDGLPLRTVLCLWAYRELPGLYDASVLVATLGERDQGAQGRFDVAGVSHENAQRLARHYLVGWTRTPGSGRSP